ncbi:MAG: tetratricopeptide repeat protein [Chloroflexota bacterium]
MGSFNTPQETNDMFQHLIGQGLTVWYNRLQDNPLSQSEFHAHDQLISFLNNAVVRNPTDFPTEQFETICRIIEVASPQFENRGLWTEWTKVLTGVLSVAKRIGTVEQKAILYHNLARFFVTQNRYAEGETAYRKAIYLTRQIGDQHNEARAYSNLGYYYIDRGHWWRSEILCLRALAIFEKLESDHGKAHTLNHLGLLYVRQRRFSEAEQSLQTAIRIWHTYDKYALFHGYMNLSLLAYEMQDGNRAIEWAEKALDVACFLEDVFVQARSKTNIAIGYVLIGKYDRALGLLQDVINMSQTQVDIVGTAIAQLNIGEIYLIQSQYQKGIQQLDVAFNTFDELNNANAMVEILNILIKYQIANAEKLEAGETLKRLKKIVQENHWGKDLLANLRQKISSYQSRLN